MARRGLPYILAPQLDITSRRISEQALRQAHKYGVHRPAHRRLARDFNNLVQVVEGSLEMVGDEPLSARQRRALGTATRSADRGSRLTKQFLAFVRETRLEPRPTNLNARSLSS